MIELTKEQVSSGFYFGYSRVDLEESRFRVFKNIVFGIEESYEDWQDNVTDLEQRVKEQIEKMPTPICVLHSSGIDSTFMLLMTRECFGADKIRVVSVGNESQASSEICKQLGVDCKVRNLDYLDALDILERMPEAMDTWFYSSSSIPTAVAIEAACVGTNSSSILTGDGGDELFCGYDRYLLRYFISFRLAWLQYLCKEKTERSQKLARFFKYGYEGLVTNWSIREIVDLTSSYPVWYGERVLPLLTESLDVDIHPLELFMFIDVVTELFGVEKQKVETAHKMVPEGMRLPIYSPFMNFGFMERALALPIEYKYTVFGGRKRFLRSSILSRFPEYKQWASKGKRGFACLGLDDWLKQGMGDKVVALRDRNLFVSNRIVRHIMDEHLQGKKVHTQKLWGLLVWRELVNNGLVRLVDEG